MVSRCSMKAPRAPRHQLLVKTWLVRFNREHSIAWRIEATLSKTIERGSCSIEWDVFFLYNQVHLPRRKADRYPTNMWIASSERKQTSKGIPSNQVESWMPILSLDGCLIIMGLPHNAQAVSPLLRSRLKNNIWLALWFIHIISEHNNSTKKQFPTCSYGHNYSVYTLSHSRRLLLFFISSSSSLLSLTYPICFDQILQGILPAVFFNNNAQPHGGNYLLHLLQLQWAW